jgi:F-type H+-transporting ATPase subunit gamma
VRLTLVGRKGYDYFRRRSVPITDYHINLLGGPDPALAVKLGARFANDFASGNVDAVYLLYNQFRSALSQIPTVERLLPVGTPAAELSDQTDYLYEPDPMILLDRLLRQYIGTLIGRSFREAIASEHGARMTAMDSATSNASDMIDRLTLEMNRARQAAITKELMEIVSGAEALRG